MKPSFAENVENCVKNNNHLAEKYSTILAYKQTKTSDKRLTRINRLKTIKWQLIYANCLTNIIDEKFKNENFTDEESKIQFYATAYNHGFNNNADNIKKWALVKSFPYGTKDQNNSFSYAEVASDFYLNVSKDLFKSTDQKVLTNK
jgi:hypothetical protein